MHARGCLPQALHGSYITLHVLGRRGRDEEGAERSGDLARARESEVAELERETKPSGAGEHTPSLKTCLR